MSPLRGQSMMSGEWWYRGRRNHIRRDMRVERKPIMEYLEQFKITFFYDSDAKHPARVAFMNFKDYDAARVWCKKEMHRDSDFHEFEIEGS